MSNDEAPREPINIEDLRAVETERAYNGVPDDGGEMEAVKPSALTKVVAIVSYYVGSLADELRQLADTSKFNVELSISKAQLAFSWKKEIVVKKRQWVIAFGPVEIPPGAIVTVQTQPQILFKGKKIVMTGDVDGLFIQGLFVGQRAQLPTFQNPVSARMFAPDVTDNEITMDTCDPALFITWQIKNDSDEPKKFAASIIGDAVL